MSVLDQLASVEFEVEVGPLLPSPLLRRRLRAMDAVRSVVEEMRKQVVTDDDIGAFARGLLANFVAGRRFDHDLALAALAVVLEDRPTPFASGFLDRLASLQLTEVATATRIARECSKHRSGTLADTTRRYVEVASPPEEIKTTVSPAVDNGRHWNGVESNVFNL